MRVERARRGIWLATALAAATSIPAQPGPNNVSGLVGGGVRYEEVQTGQSSRIQTFSLPLVLPLEASIGNLNLGGSLELVQRQVKDDVQSSREKPSSFFSLDGRYRAFQSRSAIFEITESVDLPLTRRTGPENPARADADDTTRFDTGMNVSYLINRARLRIDLGHRWNVARREYDPGDALSAAVLLGYGFGSSPLDEKGWPVNVLVGFTSRYNYADRYRNTEVMGTEYGTVFFAPGIQLSGRSLDFHATIELPIRHITVDGQSRREKVRGNIGVRYLFD